MSASFYLKMATKKNLFHFMNILIIIGSSLTMIDEMRVIACGKVIYGMAIAGMTVLTPNFLNDSVPTEIKGIISAVTGCAVTFGILTPSLFGLWIPDDLTDPKTV
jgi:MFS family permease